MEAGEGVDYTRGSGAQQVRAGEVIVCGGAINTPQLLQLSGVGNAAGVGTARGGSISIRQPAKPVEWSWKATALPGAREVLD